MIEEVIVTLQADKDELRFIIHWKGGTHTEFRMPKPKSGVGRKTSTEDLEVIRRMAVRYGNDDIARVLNKLGRRTATDKRWNEQRVAVVRQRHGIAGQQRTIADPEILTLGQAVKSCGVSNQTIRKLVGAGILKMAQVVPWAPWEIQRSDLDSPEVRAILDRLRQTGKLVLPGVGADAQSDFFNPNSTHAEAGIMNVRATRGSRQRSARRRRRRVCPRGDRAGRGTSRAGSRGRPGRGGRGGRGVCGRCRAGARHGKDELPVGDGMADGAGDPVAGLAHPALMAGGAEMASLAGEGEQALVAAVGTLEAGEPGGEIAAAVEGADGGGGFRAQRGRRSGGGHARSRPRSRPRHDGRSARGARRADGGDDKWRARVEMFI